MILSILSLVLPVLSVALGFLATAVLKSGSRATQLLLAYSGALLLSVTVFEFLPKVYQDYSPVIGVLIMSGILIQVFLEFLSRGAEHGHVHDHKQSRHFPLLLFISLCLHSFMEGFPISTNFHLLIGVVIHKIPVAIIISTFLLQSPLSKAKVMVFLVVFALMTPLGSVFNDLIISSAKVEQYINAVVIGVFLHISTTILFESSRDHRFNWRKVSLIILGVATAYLI